MGGLRSLATPARPLCLGGIPHRPPPEGALGNGMLPVFLQHLPPPVGACGERNYGLFSPGFGPKRAQKLATRGPGPNRTKPGNPRFAHKTLKSSLLVAREQPI